jgi:hypothetical protein
LIVLLVPLLLPPRIQAELEAYVAADPRPFVMPRHYICMRTTEPITIDGKLDEASWKRAFWATPHVDIRGSMSDAEPGYDTRTKLLWDDEYLYVAASLDDDHVWATITERNAVIYHDNDYEVFIDPDGDSHNYYEFEVNAFNTVWNLHLTKPYKNGGQWSVREMPGQKSGVHVLGTLNDPNDRDTGWTVEIAFPWTAMAEHANTACPPQDGDQWRMNFSRVQWRHKIVDGQYVRYPSPEELTDDLREDNWVWSPQGVINMHRPETWGYVQFSTQPAGQSADFVPDSTAPVRYLLHKILYAQEAFKAQHGRYAKTLEELGLTGLDHPTLLEPVRMHADADIYRAVAVVKHPDGTSRILTIHHDARILSEAPITP